MYEVDSCDEVVRLEDLPQPEAGAPLPALVASDSRLELGFIARSDEGESIAVIEFIHPYAHTFGPPNDEAFLGHPLAARGLEPYGCYRVEFSSWIRGLARMNSVHPNHRAEHFERLEHFIFSFHDSTFECVAKGLAVTVHPGSQRFRLSIAVTP